MRGPRFVFLSLEAAPESVVWMLVSPNNRRLGWAARPFPSYDLCRENVSLLRERHPDLKATTLNGEKDGHWAWRVHLDATVVAVSTRSYLRQQECDYNLRRFLDAVPTAEIGALARTVRIGQVAKR